MSTEQPTRTPVDFRTKPPKLAIIATAWQAWWEDNDMWDGAARYADLDAAKHHAAVDYISEEHCWLPDDDPADEAPDITLTWAFEHQRWHLLANGNNTGVQLYETHTYAPAPADDCPTPETHNWGCVCPTDQAPAAHAEEDTCRLVDLDGEKVRVHGSGDMTDEDRTALASLVGAARRRHAAEQAQHDDQVRAAGRRDGLLEGAAALQAIIDRDRTRFPHARSQSRIALGGARQILLDLTSQETTPPTQATDTSRPISPAVRDAAGPAAGGDR